MKGDSEIIATFNVILANEIAAGNQYILHSRMLDNWGIKLLGKKEFEASMDEMKHADEIIKRILFLEGIPNVQKIGKVNIGQTVEEIIQCDLDTEYNAIIELKKAVALSESKQDYVSRELFAHILKSEEEHIDWLEEQQDQIRLLGIENYIQSQSVG